MNLLSSDLLSGLFAIVLIDLVLAGDNAIVIAMAARTLPPRLQTRAVLWGTLGAVLARIVLTLVVVVLLRVPGLLLVGGLLLLPIGWKLLADEGGGPDVHAASGFWPALRTIVLADVLMGLDNMLAVAGAAHGHMGLVALGLAISVPLVVWGSTLILRLIERFPAVIYLGAAAIAWTSARMIQNERFLHGWFDARPWAGYLLDALLIGGVCGLGWYSRRPHARA